MTRDQKDQIAKDVIEKADIRKHDRYYTGKVQHGRITIELMGATIKDVKRALKNALLPKL